MNGILCVGEECVRMGKGIAEGGWPWKMENAVHMLICLAAPVKEETK